MTLRRGAQALGFLLPAALLLIWLIDDHHIAPGGCNGACLNAVPVLTPLPFPAEEDAGPGAPVAAWTAVEAEPVTPVELPPGAEPATAAPPQLRRCSAGWRPRLPAIRSARRRLWFSGCFGGAGGAKTGLNNQRQTLMTAMVIADAANATLIYGPYSTSAHDSTPLQWSDFIDVNHLQARMPHGAFQLEEAGGCVPREASVVPFPTTWKGNDSDYDLAHIVGKIATGGRDVELYTHHEFMCSGHPLWRLKKSSKSLLDRADELLSRTHRFPQSATELGRMVLAEMRKRSGGGRVHCAHIRTRYKGDHFDQPRAPLVNCTEAILLYPNCLPPDELTCFCIAPVRKSAAYWTSILRTRGKAALELEKQRPQFIDFDWQIKVAHAQKKIAKGDSVFIATIDGGNVRVRFTEEGAEHVGASHATLYELSQENNELGKRLRAIKAPVLYSAIEQAACYEADGLFFPSCLSSVSEVVVDMRRWRGDEEAQRQARLMLGILDTDLTQLSTPARCRVKPGLVRIGPKKTLKSTRGLTIRSKA
eukprot:TRINITY_DN27168_c0_g1_i1.p1 TRINITY_DN27168_c0_g1~~TRINITY_DN27168_c0_g1_i1.p1  ORF type:complete len:534 (+),score=107.31 TRINITY_DN27168_c0_g1_i1:81-1682(+)